MTTVSRGIKSGTGTKDFGAGDTILSAEVNTDLDNIVNVINGQLDNGNIAAAAGIVGTKLAAATLTNTQINASADIATTKIADDSAALSDMITAADPGDTTTPSLPTTLQGEIQRLRYAVERLAVGATAQLEDGTNQAGWIERPRFGPNLLVNGSFESANDATNTVDGWTLVGTPATVEVVSADAALGEGNALHIVSAGSAADGIEQTLSGLKPATRYLVVAWVKCATGSDEVRLVTNGGETSGDYEDLDLSTSSTDVVPLVGIVQTQDPIQDLDIELLANSDAQADDFTVDHAGVYEMGNDVQPAQGSYAVSATSTTTSTATLQGVTRGVTVPGPGYQIRVDCFANATENTGSGETLFEVDLEQDTNSAGTWGTVLSSGAILLEATNAVAAPGCVSLHAWITDPTPGTLYEFRMTVTFTDTNSGIGVLVSRGHRLSVQLIQCGVSS